MADKFFALGGGAFASASPVDTVSATPRTAIHARDAFTPRIVVTLLVAAATFWIGYDGGSYSLTSRTTLAIGVTWTALVGIFAGLLPAGRRWRSALLPTVLLAALAAFTAASATWAASAEDAFAEFNRATLYLAVFGLAALAASRATAPAIADGLALGISGVGVVALATRLFPGLVSQEDVQALLPTAFSRLSYPVNYWNGLAILLGLGFPLLLRAAVADRPALVRAAALVPLPVLAAAMYLTSSRGGFATLAVATVLLLALARERWALLEAGVLTAGASLLAILVLHARPAVVNPPLEGTAPAGPGRTAAILIALVCLGSGALYALRVRYAPPLRPAALAGYAAAAAVVLGAALAIGASHPVRQFEAFKAAPRPPARGEEDFVQSHLFSANGSGRWQFWETALDQFGDRPLRGHGAGSYDAWWAQHGSLAVFVRDAHSLYLETLGELGVVGLTLLALALLSVLATAVAGLARAGPAERTTRAALLATAATFLVAAGIDWMWELPAVGAVGFACLGLLAGLGVGPAEQAPAPGWRRRLALGIPAALFGLALIVGQGIALVKETRLDGSQAAVRRGDTGAALRAARAARDIEPWAATPYLQLALIEEQAGALAAAEARIRQAIERDRTDWRLWLTAARIQTKRGHIHAARRSYERARALNPRSPIFQR